MSEAHIQHALGKWSATTCIDLKLPNGIKCQKCLAADDLSSLGLRKSKSKKKKRIKNISCTQPWSTSFKESREQSKRNVYNKVWVHLIAIGYNSSDWTRYNEEESSCACSFRRSGAIEKKNRTKSEKEKVDAISIIESVPNPKSNGEKPASLPSNCNKVAAIHPPPIEIEGATATASKEDDMATVAPPIEKEGATASKEDDMATVADIIMHFTKEAWVNHAQQVHPMLRTLIDTASISDISTSSSVESSLATSTGTTRITDEHHQHNSSVATPVAPPATPPMAPPIAPPGAVANEPPDAACRVFHATDRTVSVQGKEVMLEQIPDTHDLVCKSYLSKLKRKANQLDALTKQVSGAKYNGTEEGNRLYGAMMALSPQTSSDNMALIVPISYAALFANAKIPIDPKALACSSPGATTLKSLVGEAAVDSMYSALAEINTDQSRIILICDKGPNGNFVKFLSWYSRAEQRVKTFNLDNDEVGGTSADCAKAIRHSLFKFFGENNARGALWGQCTDSGGGGTGKSFFKCMKDEGLTVEADQYMISFCTLHCLQLTLGVPVKTILGDGGLLQGKALFKNTAMQLLHGVYHQGP
eukprot:scaffold53061_cov27-Attheya_sp.AAC.1